jgi:hypothetical protein
LSVPFWFQTFTRASGSCFQFPSTINTSEIPFPNEPPKSQVAELDRLVAEVVRVPRNDPAKDISRFQEQVDDVVYTLHGLTPEEIKIVEGTK